MNLYLACPAEYPPDKKILENALEKKGGKINLVTDPSEAALNADVIYTDVWASMGIETELDKRKRIFEPYQVNTDLIAQASKDVIVMHCLPAHRGEEITDEVVDGSHSVVLDQAENRLHVQKAIMEILMGMGSNLYS